jgi:hypothetical protein
MSMPPVKAEIVQPRRPVTAMYRPPQQIPRVVHVVHHADPASSKNTAIVAGWLVLVIGCLVGFLPIFGFAMIALALPVCSVAGILGIIGAATGKPGSGISLIFASFVFFVAMLLIPWLAHAAWFGNP